MMHPEKMAFTVASCLEILGRRLWQPRMIAGLTGRLVFAGAFRRPLISIMNDVFHHFGAGKRGGPAKDTAYDEVLVALTLLPMAFVHLKAPISDKIYATDASPTGAGSCVAEIFKRPFGNPSATDLTCGQCRKDLTEPISHGEEVDCPGRCGRRLCGIDCYLKRKAECEHGERSIPCFSERFSGRSASLSAAMLIEGFKVMEPFDWQRDWSMDIFAESGKQWWDYLNQADPEMEHHSPESRTMCRARGAPYWVGDKRYDGPRALRGAHHVMGFSNLRGADAAAVRKANKMALRSIHRCAELHANGRFFSFEHPMNSWVWYFAPMRELAAQHGVYAASFSHCCYGGTRGTWSTFLTNSPSVFNALHRPPVRAWHCGGRPALLG